MVMVLLMTLFLALMSVALWAYTRSVLTSAAADAARLASTYRSDPGSAAATVARIMGDGPAGGTRHTLSCTSGSDGLLVDVHCTMQAPGIVGLLDGIMPTIEVTGHSARESLE